MTYVPTPVFVPPQPPPSPEVKELAQRLTAVIEEFQQGRPSFASGEIEQALGLARQKFRRPGAAAPLVTLILAGLLLAGLGVLFLFRAAVPVPAIPVIIIGVLIFALLILLVAKLGG